MTLPPGISSRAVADGDLPFLYEVYASTRGHELSLVNWTDAQKEAFVRMQFNAQHKFYSEQYPRATFDILLKEGTPIGRLYVLRDDVAHHVIDITLLPHFRGNGIGTEILKSIIAEADSAAKPVQIHVEKFNPALRLYQRLGFQQIADKGVYLLLEKATC